MKRCCALFLALILLLSGCAAGKKQHQVTYLNLFDTVTTILCNTGSEAAFQESTRHIYEQLQNYHQLFDIYNDYKGIHNLKTVNDQAGKAPVQVDPAIIALLLDCKDYYALTDGKVNVAMGSVLALWQQARQDSLADPANARLPDEAQLRHAAAHMSLDSVIIDEAASTVYISDPEVSLNVGAIAKGWACQRVAETAPAGMLISVGGNVCITGPKDAAGIPWVIGIQDPDDPSGYFHTLRATGGSVVTSGDYQRFFTVAGKAYHHIIDPANQMPATHWRSVTVVCPDSALADALSTALFLLPLEQGQALAQRCGVQALWLDAQGNEYMTEGFRELLSA